MEALVDWAKGHLVKLASSVLGISLLGWGWRMLVPNLWPVAFHILDKSVAPITDQCGVSFRVRLRVKRRTDEDIETVRARLDGRWLELRYWQQPPQDKVFNVTPIFGWAELGNYDGKTLEVVMVGRWRRGRYSIVRKVKVQDATS